MTETVTAEMGDGRSFTPNRRRELYNKHSADLTDAELWEYLDNMGVAVVPQHMMATLRARFWSRRSTPDLSEVVAVLREAFSDKTTYEDEPDDVERSYFIANGLIRRVHTLLRKLEGA